MGETYFIAQFTKGLKPEIRYVVQGQVPATMERDVMLAKIQQQVQERSKTKLSKNFSASRASSISSARSEISKTPSPPQLSKERQLRDFCRANNLCFFCKEPYDPTHPAKCTRRPKSQVNALAVNDLDVVLTDEVLEQLEVEDTLTAEFGSLSLNALAGTEQEDAMRSRVLVKNKVMLVLIDSGSSHTFVSSHFLDTVGIQSVPTQQQVVKVANGDTLISDRVVPELAWWTQGHTFYTRMGVLDLGAYDCILGYDWIKQHSPITHNWEEKTMQFSHKGVPITIKGIHAASLTLQELSMEKAVKWSIGNDIWVCALLTTFPDPDQEVDPAIKEVLNEFQDVFAPPTKLPPSRFYDHSIPILPDSIPVNSRSYRYSPLHKDEIEKQVRQLLDAGLITPSTSPYASPVLLVQKKDGTWRFCVDYRKLNDMTIKNRFPMPITDEIVHELAGTKYFTKLDMCAGYHQVRMRPEDEHKTAFKTHHGHYQFRVMPFGLTNMPATFNV